MGEKKKSMNYVLKRKTCPYNPAYSCVFKPPNSKLFGKSKLTPPLGLHVLPLLEDSKIDFGVVGDIMCPTPLLGVNLGPTSV